MSLAPVSFLPLEQISHISSLSTDILPVQPGFGRHPTRPRLGLSLLNLTRILPFTPSTLPCGVCLGKTLRFPSRF